MLALADKGLKTPAIAMLKDMKKSIMTQQIVNLSCGVEEGWQMFSKRAT